MPDPADAPLSPQTTYQSLTQDEADHFLEHGWIKVPNAIEPKYIDPWLEDFWIRSGLNPNDPSTWQDEYLHMAHHRQAHSEVFYPEAWRKILDICGGEHMIHPERERWVGDNFVINFGSEERKRAKDQGQGQEDPRDRGYHWDNDWYRGFLDSSGTAMTIICCFTDIPEKGGGTWLCEDGLKNVLEFLYEHPEGVDPSVSKEFGCETIPSTCNDFTQVVAKKGDVFLTHGFLPHGAGFNYLHYPRIISNPHITLRRPHNLNREDGNYNLLERVILKNLGRDAIPEFKPTRPRKEWYPRNVTFKLNKVPSELERLKADAKARGEDEDSIDSFWLRGGKDYDDFIRTNGLDYPMNDEAGLELAQHKIA